MIGNAFYELTNKSCGDKIHIGKMNIKIQRKNNIPYICVGDYNVQKWCDRFPAIYKKFSNLSELDKHIVSENPLDGLSRKVEDNTVADNYASEKFQNLKSIAKCKGLIINPSVSKNDLLIMLREHDAKSKFSKGTSSEDN